MNILICSSIREESEFFYNNLQRMFHGRGVEPLIFCFRNTNDVVEYLSVSPDEPDAIIISVPSQDSDSIDQLQQMSETYEKTNLILLSKEAGNVERLFSIGLSYFLYSPVSEKSFLGFEKRMMKKWFSDTEKYFILESKSLTRRIAYSDILYVMSDKRKVIMYQPNGITDSLYGKLDEIEKKLDERFIRCHQSFLVNSQYIRGIDVDGFTLIDNIFIPISQKKYWTAKRRYIQQIKNQG